MRITAAWSDSAHYRPPTDAGNHVLDAILLERVTLGDTAAFATLLNVWWRPLVAYCARILDAGENAEDVAQETFIRFWEHRATWKPGTSARAILYTIARNLALNQRKSAAARAQRLTNPPLAIVRRFPSPDEQVESDEFAQALERAISRLPARQREVLTLSRFDGLARAEIAEVTGLSPQTVGNYLTAALNNLRTALAAFL